MTAVDRRFRVPTRIVLLVLSAILGCGSPRPSPPVADSAPAAVRPADSLVVTAPGGVEVWFTDARQARDTAGRGCVERVMQIRRDGHKLAIPLLYTGSIPRLVNDSTIEAPIWLNCRPGNVYQVDLKTGRPVRVR